MSSLFENNIEGEKLVTSTYPVSLAKVRFGYGPGMQKQWVINSAKFLDYISSRFGQSVRASLEVGKVVVTEIDRKILPRFETEVEMKAHVTGLKYWQQEEYTLAKENHNKFTMAIRQKLSTVYRVLFSIYEVSLRSR